MTLRQTCSRPKPRAQCAFKNSMTHELHRSHYISHLVAFFIVARAKISVVESFSHWIPVRVYVETHTAECWLQCVLCVLECLRFHIPLEGCENGGARGNRSYAPPPPKTTRVHGCESILAMILPQVHLRKPCYDFSFL